MKRLKPWMTGKNVATAVFLLLADWLVITAVWMKVRFGTIDMTTILFQLKVPMSGADPGNFYEIFIFLLTVGTAMLLAEIGLLFLVRKWRANRLAKAKNAGVPGGILSWRRIIALGLMIAALCFVGYRLHIVRYVVNQFGNSPIYDDEYRYPENTAIAAPENKRNLIFIYNLNKAIYNFS